MKDIKSWGYLALITMLWWGVLYPEFSLTTDNYRIVDEEGVLSEYEISEHEAAEMLMDAAGEEVIIKSRLWELLKEWSRSTHEEECNN